MMSLYVIKNIVFNDDLSFIQVLPENTDLSEFKEKPTADELRVIFEALGDELTAITYAKATYMSFMQAYADLD